MPIGEFRDCGFHNGAVVFVFRYDEDNQQVDAVRCMNNHAVPAFFQVRAGANVFSDTCPPGQIKEFNIPPGILNQMVLGFDDEEPTVVSTSNSSFEVEYRA